jgi:hypothetical protein
MQTFRKKIEPDEKKLAGVEHELAKVPARLAPAQTLADQMGKDIDWMKELFPPVDPDSKVTVHVESKGKPRSGHGWFSFLFGRRKKGNADLDLGGQDYILTSRNISLPTDPELRISRARRYTRVMREEVPALTKGTTTVRKEEKDATQNEKQLNDSYQASLRIDPSRVRVQKALTPSGSKEVKRRSFFGQLMNILLPTKRVPTTVNPTQSKAKTSGGAETPGASATIVPTTERGTKTLASILEKQPPDPKAALQELRNAIKAQDGQVKRLMDDTRALATSLSS